MMRHSKRKSIGRNNIVRKRLAAAFALCLCLFLLCGTAFAGEARLMEQSGEEESVLTDEVTLSDEIVLEEAATEEAEEIADEDAMIIEKGSLSLNELTLLSEVQALEEELEATGTEYDGFLVTLEDGTELPDASDQQTERLEYIENVCVAESAEEILHDYDCSDILRVEPNYISHLSGTIQEVPNDPFFKNGDQQYLDMINLSYAWEKGLFGEPHDGADPIVVAVLDSGYYPGHEDMRSDHILYEKSFVDGDSTMTDYLRHGTACASIIMAVRNNGKGIAGVVPEVYVVPVKIFGEKDETTEACIAEAIDYAADLGVDVISMSFSGSGSTYLKEAAVKNAAAKGILMVASAGNSNYGHTAITYPAAYTTVVGVGSVNSAMIASDFSESNIDSVFCTAQGEGIVVAGVNYNSYYTADGTSFSCPQVAGVAALVKSLDRSTNSAGFRKLLKKTCTDLGPVGKDADYGYGLVNVEQIIKQLLPAKSVTLNKASIDLPIDSTFRLTGTVYPENAAEKALTWTSAKSSIARVSQNGLVRGVKAGSTMITATVDYYTNVKSKCRVTVLFDDVLNKKAYYYKPVRWALIKNLTAGYNGKYFKPEKTCTRKEMAAFLWRLSGRPACSGTVKFTDVNYTVTSDSYQSILWAEQNKIVGGYSDGTFRPKKEITRAEALIMLYRYAGRPAVSGTMPFSDMKSYSGDKYRAVLWASQNGIAGGYADGTFKPANTSTRSHVITFLYRQAH